MAETSAARVLEEGCPACGTELGPSMLSCPECQRLVHAEELKALAGIAASCEQNSDLSGAAAAWRSVLPLLPFGSGQRVAIEARLRALSDRLVEGSPLQRGSAQKKKSGWGMGAVGAAIIGLLSKGKLILLGLTKWKTLLTMGIALSVYWTMWGWKFALGIVLCIYVHEMGHVIALRRFGIAASAPMFIPGLGAFIRLKQSPTTTREDARTGIAGPIYGLGVSVVVLIAGVAAGSRFLLDLASVNAWINLFNLTPFLSLDGGRAFRSLSARQRWAAVAVVAVLFALTHQGMLILVGIAGAVNAYQARQTQESDLPMCVQYGTVAAALMAVMQAVVYLGGSAPK